MDAHLELLKSRRTTPLVSVSVKRPKGARSETMERLKLEKPRQSTLFLCPLSPALPIGVHWHKRSWVCADKDQDCHLCVALPRRGVVYFAAAVKLPGHDGGSHLGLFERSAAWYHEACRQSGTNWNEALRQFSIQEQVEGKTRTVVSTTQIETQEHLDLVSIERLAFSVAALFQMPKFPSCSTVAQAQRALAAFSARQQSLLLAQTTEVL